MDLDEVREDILRALRGEYLDVLHRAQAIDLILSGEIVLDRRNRPQRSGQPRPAQLSRAQI